MSASRRELLRLPMKVIQNGKMEEERGRTVPAADPPRSAVDLNERGNGEGTTPPCPPRKRGGKDSEAYWRSQDELKGTEDFQSFHTREFQDGASELEDPLSRRQFLSLMGASVALAGLAGCRKPVEKIVPYVRTPEETVIGKPEQYATSAVIAGSVAGLLVTSRDGRPIKIEGNPLHPSSLGGTTTFQQAAILGLYDPDRSKKVLHRGAESDWNDFTEFWRGERAKYLANGGKGLAVLGEGIHSPTLLRLKKAFLSAYPGAIWAEYDPISDKNVRTGLKWALGGDFIPQYDYSKAKVILSLDSDFLNLEGDIARNTRQFAEGRRITNDNQDMNRLYVIESNFSVTGAMADHRLRARNVDIKDILASLRNELVQAGIDIPLRTESKAFTGKSDQFVKALAKDLINHNGQSLVVAGWSQPPAVHRLAVEINEALGNVGQAVAYIPADEPLDNSLGELGAGLEVGTIETLVTLGGNPALNAPWLETLNKVPHLIHFGDQVDETGKIAEWHLPRSHFLESWGDSRANDGTLSIQQPLIEPLFGSRGDIEFAGFLIEGVEVKGYDLVRETWKGTLPPLDFEKQWRRILHDGLLAGSAAEKVTPAVQWVNPTAPNAIQEKENYPFEGLELVLKPSPSVWDGRYATNGWLQELPDPMTKLVWDNAALISPATARKLDLATEDVVNLTANGRSIEAPIFILPGHADDSITVTPGYGRKGLGESIEEKGFNAYPLFTGIGIGSSAVTISKTNRTYKLASSQNHHSMEGRPIVREGTLEEYKAHPEFAAEMVHMGAEPSMWEEHKYDEGYQWGMTIDLNTCTGCNACAIACQSENNIPIVGKDQVARGREMHWIRLDRYFTGDEENPQAVTQPVACQQCEMAPCEQVCPVAATSHDHEGLNVMTYNRCVGTRYCANNCPYKVRRFNFFNFTSKLDELIQMAQNPDVTVRSRGVMEKCTYCVQRINRGKHDAKMENRDVRDGEVVSACQAACPAGAIVFGNLNDPNSAVSKSKKEHRNYDLLGELNTRPRTSYLAKIRNVNADLGEES